MEIIRTPYNSAIPQFLNIHTHTHAHTHTPEIYGCWEAKQILN